MSRDLDEKVEKATSIIRQAGSDALTAEEMAPILAHAGTGVDIAESLANVAAAKTEARVKREKERLEAEKAKLAEVPRSALPNDIFADNPDDIVGETIDEMESR